MLLTLLTWNINFIYDNWTERIININKILQVSSILIFVLIFFHSVSTKDLHAENGSDNKVFNHDDFRKNISPEERKRLMEMRNTTKVCLNCHYKTNY